MRPRLRIAFRPAGIALLLALSASLLGAQPTCNFYYNSRPTWVQDYGPVCAYTGAGCRECVGMGGTVCVDGGGAGGCLDYPYY